jgi:hypothetical protein
MQLTDGAWNDFDPCWLPNGRIAFVSERRGGYLRCGRTCPTYTLFDMAADGHDIMALSHHETHEWQPSVTADGMIIYTRWDYIDRHGCVAHGSWTMTPDGRNARALIGNYTPKSTRPDVQMDIRAIPDSPRYVATATGHHVQAYGSLVLLDPRLPDDEGMSAIKRITPEAQFPESQKGREMYGEAWPLSEHYFLASYDPGIPMGRDERLIAHGIYLVDIFGNKELLYRELTIGSHSPIPLRSRSIPPVVPELSTRGKIGATNEATVGLINVYDSLKPWPRDTHITGLRVFQVIPLPMPSAEVHHSLGMQIVQAADSINVGRSILGEVPVESDGSAYFTVPAGKELFFQALNEEGLAVTSMRSGVEFQPGESAICQGCHEPRTGTPKNPANTPIALRRAPSRLTPGPDGSDPFSYARLVQPVLDRYCVDCHAKNDKAPPLDRHLVRWPGNGGMDVPTDYYASYLSLAPQFGFYDYGTKDWNNAKWYETTPGEFGALASKLLPLLKKGHFSVKLPPEDLKRITLWLDACSPFYGVYEKEGGEAQLRGEIAVPSLE